MEGSCQHHVRAQSTAAAADGCSQLATTADESMILVAAAELPSEETIAGIANQDYRSGIFRLQKPKKLKFQHLLVFVVFSQYLVLRVFPTTD